MTAISTRISARRRSTVSSHRTTRHQINVHVPAAGLGLGILVPRR